jgi:hypothetical protein
MDYGAVGNPELETPEWFYKMRDFDIASLLKDPRQDLQGPIVSRLVGKAELHKSNWAASLEEDQQSWQLFEDDIRALEDLRRRLDVWWSGRSDEFRSQLLSNRLGMVPGECREEIWEMRPEGERSAEPSGSLRGNFKLPPIFYGYVQAISGGE